MYSNLCMNLVKLVGSLVVLCLLCLFSYHVLTMSFKLDPIDVQLNDTKADAASKIIRDHHDQYYKLWAKYKTTESETEKARLKREMDRVEQSRIRQLKLLYAD